MTINDKLTEHQKRVLWFVRIRWGAIIIMAAVLLISKYIGNLNIAVRPALIIIALAAAYNLIYPFIIRRFRYFSSSQLSAYIRMLFDLLVVTSLIHFTGGIESSFSFLYPLEVSTVALFGFTTLAYFVALNAAIFFAVTCRLEAAFLLPHYRTINLPGTLFLSPAYIYIYAVSIFLFSCLMIYMVSYLADKFKEKQREIEQISAEKTDFMNNVAHELRSPLTSIKEYTSLFLEGLMGQVEEKQREPLLTIDRQAKRMIGMISDLLDIARIESGTSGFEKKETNLTQVIENAITEMMPQFNLKHIVLLQEMAINLPLVKIDENKILEVLINLFANAVKFSREGGKILITVKKISEGIIVSVKDEGNGIDTQDLSHIFEKFYRAQKENSIQKGTGLGLALCKSIIERHGGRIWAESEGIGKGATFHFTLPLK